MNSPRTPDSTAELLIRLIGEAAALRLMDIKNFGGRSIDFPKSEVGPGAQSFAAIAEVIGMPHAKRLCRQFGGDRMYIPNLRLHFMAKRNQRMVNAYNTGTSIGELVREHEISDRRVRDILKSTDMVNTQHLVRGVQESLF